jgi:hypothetical protein
MKMGVRVGLTGWPMNLEMIRGVNVVVYISPKMVVYLNPKLVFQFAVILSKTLNNWYKSL